MPRFSVIVPAYKVQAYLHECLESVLSQSFTDLELIVVDDRSPDACGEIIDEFAARDYRRYRTPGVPVPLRARMRHTLVHFGVHRTYRALQACMTVRRRTHKAGAKLARALKAVVLQAHYRIQLRLPLRADRAVFAAYWGRGHSCNPGALEAAFRTFAPQVRTAWIARPEYLSAVPPGPRRVRPGTAAYWTALARSKYLVNNVNFDRRLVKRPGQVFVQTQHGCPWRWTPSSPSPSVTSS